MVFQRVGRKWGHYLGGALWRVALVRKVRLEAFGCMVARAGGRLAPLVTGTFPTPWILHALREGKSPRFILTGSSFIERVDGARLRQPRVVAATSPAVRPLP